LARFGEGELTLAAYAAVNDRLRFRKKDLKGATGVILIKETLCKLALGKSAARNPKLT
jgi:hypothetical protein